MNLFISFEQSIAYLFLSASDLSSSFAVITESSQVYKFVVIRFQRYSALQ